MKKYLMAIATLLMGASIVATAQRYEKVQYGDFENWTVRNIKESAVLGGETRKLYVVGPSQTIDGNKTFLYNNTIWAGSNAYAKVAGITKVSVSVTPDNGPSGKCAKLQTCMAECKVAGVVDISVLAQGSLFWGKILEPITGTSNPYSFMDWGIPFTKRPSAVVLDYKALVPNTGEIIKGGKAVKGSDAEQIYLILQHRYEDENGVIHAKRVGTAFLRISKTTSGWVKDARIPVIYGDATKSPKYKAYMNLMGAKLYAINSKGKKKKVIEDEWGDESTPVTHAIMSITSGSAGTFAGALDNTLWVDNIRLEYDK